MIVVKSTLKIIFDLSALTFYFSILKDPEFISCHRSRIAILCVFVDFFFIVTITTPTELVIFTIRFQCFYIFDYLEQLKLDNKIFL